MEVTRRSGIEGTRVGQSMQVVRTAQSVLHKRIADRQEADALGYTIADFVMANWAIIVDEFGQGSEDEYEIVERVTLRVLRDLPVSSLQ